ncbi:GFA family protein [Neorhizobium galegae]|uniref:GFA family protein n=1 Tax=Neorhizobium galegae TaxID=399 RepID=UPI0006223C61|nr:GFA family protein [Neorhizobium galegae]CDZ25380.1 Glutathione-dependent formaldehyde-activating GFA [Neorhizobium galegae bv. officinalis]KAA9387761.1 GFA family protein [Neorhizobium galegae]KAB1115769.1 GFA family protein [Neorhizobium galegae]MCM2498323.1 GFA family protein [Neorhizobium galegae]MCQ1765668.1 GFA family protein [Neorhizobium galegae]
MRIAGSCHCGNVAFEAEGEFDTAMECNCSLCRRKGVLLAFVPRSQFELATSRENLSSYQFNKHVITHYFCTNCGIAPFSEATMPNGAEMAAINLRCVPEIDIATLTVTQYDGASR